MSAVAADESHRVVEVAVAEIAPHPFNDDARSRPQPGDPKWQELLNGVRANGVRLPVLVVPREAFAAARPSMAEQISPEARYVLVYGHRRRAAALEAGRATMPAVVDDSIMADDGDLDAMAAENLGRQDLSDLAEADLFARYSDIGLSQRAIAVRLGIDQATVSRRLALLLLAPEVRAAVERGQIPGHEAPGFAGVLPYGPLRRWQKKKDPEQDSQRRRGEQLEALRLVLDRGWLPSRAADRVVAEREARAEAAALDVTLVDDPEAELGADYVERRISREQFVASAEVIGAINANTGTLDLYDRTPSLIADSAPPTGETDVPTPAADPTTAPPRDTDPNAGGDAGVRHRLRGQGPRSRNDRRTAARRRGHQRTGPTQRGMRGPNHPSALQRRSAQGPGSAVPVRRQRPQPNIGGQGATARVGRQCRRPRGEGPQCSGLAPRRRRRGIAHR